MLLVDSCRSIRRNVVVSHRRVRPIAHTALRRSQLAIRILHVVEVAHGRLGNGLTVGTVHLRRAWHVDMI